MKTPLPHVPNTVFNYRYQYQKQQVAPKRRGRGPTAPYHDPTGQLIIPIETPPTIGEEARYWVN